MGKGQPNINPTHSNSGQKTYATTVSYQPTVTDQTLHTNLFMSKNQTDSSKCTHSKYKYSCSLNINDVA